MSLSGTDGKVEAVTHNLFNSGVRGRGWVWNWRSFVLEIQAERGMFRGLSKGGECKDEWRESAATLR